MVEGIACNAGAAFSPAPRRGTLTGDFRSGLEIVNAPFSDAVRVGAKAMFMLRLLPGVRMTGTLAESREKLAPVTRSECRSTFLLLVLVI